MKISYGTDVGIIRNDNQDSVSYREFSENCGLFVVADGMGGHRGGKTASSIAVETITHVFFENYTQQMRSEEIKELLRHAVNIANTQIFEKSDSDEELYGMGTTVVVLFVCDNTLYTASVGDSRAYVFNGNRAHQITTDHSLVADLLSRGIISEEEAKNHPQKNVITRAVGSEPSLTVDVFQTNLDSDNIIVGCSDGLYSMVSEEEIAVIINDNIENSAEKLIKLANERGGQDNITVVVAKIS